MHNNNNNDSNTLKVVYITAYQTGNIALSRVFSPVATLGTAGKKYTAAQKSIFPIEHNTKVNTSNLKTRLMINLYIDVPASHMLCLGSF